MVRKMKLKHNVVYENILDKFNVGHCGIKVKVTFTPAKFNHSIFFKSPADGSSVHRVGKVIAQDTNYISLIQSGILREIKLIPFSSCVACWSLWSGFRLPCN